MRTPNPRRSKYCCPTCGHPVLPKDPLAILSHTERAIFDIIYRSGQAGVTRKALHDRLYDGRRNGADSASIISVHVNAMNKRLKWLGVEVYGLRSNEVTYRVRRCAHQLTTELDYPLLATTAPGTRNKMVLKCAAQ